jgi:hypothetical protein
MAEDQLGTLAALIAGDPTSFDADANARELKADACDANGGLARAVWDHARCVTWLGGIAGAPEEVERTALNIVEELLVRL